ncbi:Zinc/iron permease [Cadophora sp. DSE1049]|nr:Zinc/iron permease [Cadophora sp. DSE1049]
MPPKYPFLRLLRRQHLGQHLAFDGRLGLRISAIFVILVGSAFNAGAGVPDWLFFVVKYFGSGVIVATAFIYLLAPAYGALTDPCLTGPITEYTWVEEIALMIIIVMFFVELLIMRYANFGSSHEANNHRLRSSIPQAAVGSHINDPDSANEDPKLSSTDLYIIFHSVFIGLTLAVASEEFKTLYIVLVFHQTFKGLGLSARLSTVPWPGSKRATPYLFRLRYSIFTPLAIAIGFRVRNSYPPGSQTTLIVNSVFDSISASILIYIGLVELAPIRVTLLAFRTIYLRASLMAVLGK